MTYRADSRLNSSRHLKYDSQDPQRDPSLDAKVLKNGFPQQPVHQFASPSDPQSPEIKTGSADMDVTGPGSVSGTYPLNSLPQLNQSTPPAEVQPISTRDEVEITPANSTMIDETPPAQNLRALRLEQIKQAIEAGTYDTDEKLEFALERMFDAVLDGEDPAGDSSAHPTGPGE